MKYIKLYESAGSVINVEVETPFIGMSKEKSLVKYASVAEFGEKVKMVADTVNDYFKPYKEEVKKYILKLSANGAGQIVINSGYINADGFIIPDWNEGFTRDADNDTVIDDVQYYAFYDEVYDYRIYLKQDLNDKSANEEISDVAYYEIEDNDVTYNSEEDDYLITITVTKYDSNYTGPLQETILYSAGDNQEIEVNQEILSLSAVQVEDEEGNTINTTLTSITIPDSVTSIGERAFFNCSRLTGTLTIPNSVTTVGNGAFYNCWKLTSLTIGNSVTSIGEAAFDSCTGLTGLIIGNSVKTISDYAFSQCSGLTSVTIPNSVKTIGAYAFWHCTGLTGTLTIPNSVTSIGDDAFYNCSGLTSVTIPDSVTSIGEAAFDSCTGLTSITFNGTTTQWNAITFGTGWKTNVPATEVTCSDGTVTLS